MASGLEGGRSRVAPELGRFALGVKPSLRYARASWSSRAERASSPSSRGSSRGLLARALQPGRRDRARRPSGRRGHRRRRSRRPARRRVRLPRRHESGRRRVLPPRRAALPALDGPPGRYHEYRCAEYAKPARCLSARKHQRFCIDRRERAERGHGPASQRPVVDRRQAGLRGRGRARLHGERVELRLRGRGDAPLPLRLAPRGRQAATPTRWTSLAVREPWKLRDERDPAGAHPRAQARSACSTWPATSPSG